MRQSLGTQSSGLETRSRFGGDSGTSARLDPIFLSKSYISQFQNGSGDLYYDVI